MPKTYAVDFDGVIHAYSKGWQDGTIYDRPMEGAVEALKRMLEEGSVFIFTSREPEQIMPWLQNLGFDVTIDERCGECLALPATIGRKICEVCKGSGQILFWNLRGQILVTNRKLPAFAYIDDRGIRFHSWDQTLYCLGMDEREDEESTES